MINKRLYKVITSPNTCPRYIAADTFHEVYNLVLKEYGNNIHIVSIECTNSSIQIIESNDCETKSSNLRVYKKE